MSRYVRVVFLWHMHQPLYRDSFDGRYLLPWVRMHSLSGYSDVARALERAEKPDSTVNFVPVLLEQIEDYAYGTAKDRFWDLTIKPAEELSQADKDFILQNFFSCRWETKILPTPRYWQLLKKRESTPHTYSVSDFRDLQVLFNLAWFGPSALEMSPGVRELKERERNFTEEDKVVLAEGQTLVLQQLLPRWRALQDVGKVELSASPYYHPILPLVIDTNCARRAMPGVPLPMQFSYPEDARLHVERAKEKHRTVFGREPSGMWPSEGSVSPEMAKIVDEAGFRWMATDEGVLHRSPGVGGAREDTVYRPWLAPDSDDLVIFFRDREMSDLIGFTYGQVSPSEAAEDLLNRLRRVPGQNPVVTIALDGENPWEGYADGGQEFLARVYEGIHKDPQLVCTTPSRILEEGKIVPGKLQGLHSGSWIESNFHIWIGGAEENKAWSALTQVRKMIDDHAPAQAGAGAAKGTGKAAGKGAGKEMAKVGEQAKKSPVQELRQRALDMLLPAEGSDWFWWYGDQFTSVQDLDFDQLFRRRLQAACAALGQEPPPAVYNSFVEGSHVMKQPGPLPRDLITPIVDGRVTGFYEWTGAGRYELDGNQGSMYRGVRYLKTFYWCFDLDKLYVRIDPENEWLMRREEGWWLRIQLEVRGEQSRQVRIDIPLDHLKGSMILGGNPAWGSEVEAVMEDVLEISVAFGRLGMEVGEKASMVVMVMKGKVALERYPVTGEFQLIMPDQTFSSRHWWV